MKIKKSKKKQTNIAELEKIRTLFFDQTIQLEEDQQGMIFSMIDWFMETVIDTIKEFQGKQDKIRRQADDNWRVLQYYGDTLIEINKEIKKLKRKDSGDMEIVEPDPDLHQIIK